MNRPDPFRVYWSYARYLLKEFRWPLGLFLGMIFGGGLLMHLLHEDKPAYGEACYTVFRMLFFEPAEKFPRSWVLEVFCYMAPVLPAARVVLRIFDDTLARKFAAEFKMSAISTSQAASHHFVAAATGRSVYFTFQLDRHEVHMADLSLTPASKLIGKSLQEIESDNSVRVVCYHSGATTDLHPKPDIRLKVGDTIVVLASHEKIRKLEELNR